MKAYKYNTKVSQEGTIKIPHKQSLAGKKVEVIVVPKTDNKQEDFSAKAFIDKWAGFLSSDKQDNHKYQYLSEKYK